jgi:hypothetical protein
MPGGIARVGDILGPGGIIGPPASLDVYVNGRPAALIGAAYTPHPCCGAKKCPPTHCFGVIGDLPSGTYVNGLPVLTNSGIGICGHKVMTASFDVFAVGGSALAGVASMVLSRALLG